ncbi:MAG: hypothetical protein R6V57_13765 [Vicinamibacterales bacterium]
MNFRLLLAAALTVVAASCGGTADTAAPLATPTVSVNHTRVPLGSPIEVRYSFQVAPSARFDRDYRVMVHFLDADDELMWTDDHMPPQPTSAWKPGETITYTRTVFVPLYPYIGEAAIAIGLYAPGTGDRAPLSGDAIGQRAYRAARIRLQPQTDNVFLAFLDGWHAPETAADNQSVEWQWTRKEGVLRFRNPKRNAAFYLHYDGQPSMFDTPQNVTVSLGAEVLDTFEVATTDAAIRKIAIKAAQFGPDEVVLLRIAVDRTFVPALASPGSRDSRELGIRVFHAFVEPQ